MSTMTTECPCGCHVGASEPEPTTSQTTSSDPGQPPDVRSLVSSILEDLRQDAEVRDDVESALRVISSGEGHSTALRKAIYKHRPVYHADRLAQRRVARELERLRQDAEEGWDRARPAGRLNVARWVATRDDERAFDAWRDRKGDAGDLEVVILLDDSESMKYRYTDAARAMWVLKRSLDGIGASTTVMVFDHRSRILYRADERAERDTFRLTSDGFGSTDPSAAVAQAARIFSGSRRSTKILITITDGYYGGHYTARGVHHGTDAIIAALGRGGVTTAQVLYQIDMDETHEHQMHVRVDDADGLVVFVRDLVSKTIRSQWR